MDEQTKFKIVSTSLLNWYNLNKRELPWRETKDPYKIWISEIVLQQTRVNQGINYYLRFVNRFPQIFDLANASENEVLKYWQGLGYYSRARNLHKSAIQILNEYEGKFPTEYSEVLKLSGIGYYTAAAICSFAYNMPYAVVDGNVYRVLARLFAIETPIDSNEGKKMFSSLANSLLIKTKPGEYNQAIMEFGALQCVPTSPDCDNCVLNSCCQAYKLNLVNNLPFKEKKIKVRHRYLNYFYIEFSDKFLLNKRTGKDIWENLFEFPLIETDKQVELVELVENKLYKELFDNIPNVEFTSEMKEFKHVLSHQIIQARFIKVRIPELNMKLKTYTLIPFSEIEKYPVSRLIDKYLEHISR